MRWVGTATAAHVQNGAPFPRSGLAGGLPRQDLDQQQQLGGRWRVAATAADAAHRTADGSVSATVPDAPPPRSNAAWGAADGLTGPIDDVSTDEAGNVWAIGETTLFLLTPIATRFTAFGNADGLHVEPFVARDSGVSLLQ